GFVRLGAGVAEKDARSGLEALREPLGDEHPRLGVEEVRGVDELAGLVADCLDHIRVAVAGVADGDPGEEVEVGVALRVIQGRALAAHELDRSAPVRLHHVARFQLSNLLRGRRARAHHALTFVPIPASVKSSSRSEWGSRPSTMWAKPTPESTAEAH